MSARALAALPDSLQDAVRLAYVGARVTQDRESLRTYRRLMREPDRTATSEASLARLRLRPLGGREVVIRPGTSDLATLWTTFARGYHLPPRELGSPSTIWDLGANIGLTMAHFLCLFPRARVLGVEMDRDNVGLARQNLASWGDRYELAHAAVWPSDGEVSYRRWPGGTNNYQATEEVEGLHVQALSLNTLMAERPETVDYLKVDIEGAERAVLNEDTDWSANVRCLKVELHGQYSFEECENDLRRLGFQTQRDPQYSPCVIALRP
jgi:FkbM family methyltransferase